MSAACCNQHDHQARARQAAHDRVYRRALWAVLAINSVMFAAEIVTGLAAGSVALLADSLDFLGDAANYAISLTVVGLALTLRARASLVKAVTMLAFGAWVVGAAIWNLAYGVVPEAQTMGVVGLVALLANAASFAILWRFRAGDSNMRSAWICTRNDVLGNLAVLLAALGVFGTGSGWPDAVVAAIMGSLALQGAVVVARQALGELRRGPAVAAD